MWQKGQSEGTGARKDTAEDGNSEREKKQRKKARERRQKRRLMITWRESHTKRERPTLHRESYSKPPQSSISTIKFFCPFFICYNSTEDTSSSNVTHIALQLPLFNVLIFIFISCIDFHYFIFLFSSLLGWAFNSRTETVRAQQSMTSTSTILKLKQFAQICKKYTRDTFLIKTTLCKPL